MKIEEEHPASADPQRTPTIGHSYGKPLWEPHPQGAAFLHMFAFTGELRRPRAGEWFLMGFPLQAHYARTDKADPFPIAIPFDVMSGPDIVKLIRADMEMATAIVGNEASQDRPVYAAGWNIRRQGLAEVLAEIPGTPEWVESQLKQREAESKLYEDVADHESDLDSLA